MEELGRGRFLRLVRRGRWEWAERVNVTGVVVVVAVTPEGALLLVEQHRPPLDARVIELPAGLAGDVDEAEALSTAAIRELEEETGWRARSLEHLTEGPVSAGMSTERLTFFGGWDLVRTGPGGGTDGEDITVHEVPLPAVADFLADRARAGVLVDPKVYAGLYFAEVRSPEEQS